ncbi:sulfurtransferase-like selenium metabolism protein YedF [Clostridium cylindrosporum]|uniref:Selenium metabolism protein YedF n=1 Tax=Clostridium cylindrosporum DSM 605 TaxID=1121307 RepID=A0A0J8DBT6_CLOCY|nr:sulfurtransferase-like selenium metabolism protein YedF [Clostridium cylindrosporum]KMT21774.1 selenium metabolism protein YedF [Clostridium cylindrosporum DSM 605]
MKTIDCRGLECPKPVINTKKTLDQEKGQVIEVLVDNEVARENVSKFLSGQGVGFTVNEKDGYFSIVTEVVSEGLSNKVEEKIVDDKSLVNIGSDVILFSSDKLGKGDDKLGEALMKSFMFALSESKLPSAMLFVNGGVKLTTEGSDVIDTIKELESKGVEVLSCGTCLDFYELKDKLLVGGITNMYTIIEHLQKSGKVISL